MAAQQAELQGRLAALAVLGERREALADHLASINLLIAQAKVRAVAHLTKGRGRAWLVASVGLSWLLTSGCGAPGQPQRPMNACLPAYLRACDLQQHLLTSGPMQLHACLVVQAAEEARSAELSELELALRAAQAAAEAHRLQASCGMAPVVKHVCQAMCSSPFASNCIAGFKSVSRHCVSWH